MTYYVAEECEVKVSFPPSRVNGFLFKYLAQEYVMLFSLIIYIPYLIIYIPYFYKGVICSQLRIPN